MVGMGKTPSLMLEQHKGQSIVVERTTRLLYAMKGFFSWVFVVPVSVPGGKAKTGRVCMVWCMQFVKRKRRQGERKKVMQILQGGPEQKKKFRPSL